MSNIASDLLHRLVLFLLALSLLSACSSAEPPAERAGPVGVPVLIPQQAGTSVRLIGAHAADERVAWLSGTDGTYARTTDGGRTWQVGVVPGADSLQFRDVYAASADTALLLSIGPGAASRIYRTTDGGAYWRRVFTNPEPEGFFDCMAFWEDGSGLAFSDAVGDTFPIVVTRDGGRTWRRVPADRLPPAQPGEGSFAASGTCVTTYGDSTAWIGTGGAERVRVLRTEDRGRTWTAAVLPLAGGEARGVAAVAFRDLHHGVALGGDLAGGDTGAGTTAWTEDGGRTWRRGGPPSFPGAVYGAAYVPETDPRVLVAVGPGGSAYSRDDGRSWSLADTSAYWGVTFASPSAGWLAGPRGRITKVMFE